MTIEVGLFQAIQSQPDDMGPRLIFADWLEEHGREDRAELIRIQCSYPGLSREIDRFPAGGPERTAGAERLSQLMERAYALIKKLQDELHSPLLDVLKVDDAPAPKLGYDFDFRCNRGFIEGIECWGATNAERFVNCIFEVSERTPLQVVRFITRWAVPGSAYDEYEEDPVRPDTLREFANCPEVRQLRVVDFGGPVPEDVAVKLRANGLTPKSYNEELWFPESATGCHQWSSCWVW